MSKLIRMLTHGAGKQAPEGKEGYFEKGRVYEVSDYLADRFVGLHGAVELSPEEIQNLKPEDISQPQ